MPRLLQEIYYNNNEMSVKILAKKHLESLGQLPDESIFQTAAGTKFKTEIQPGLLRHDRSRQERTGGRPETAVTGMGAG